ncbi:HNH endonuclease [Pseudonocardiaceae bacterium YIM PH 21723]|nr:HNH endonuclease [Pseudonocardiaceae bacterium YIM PH 21723]
MSWTTSQRSQQLPDDWPALRAGILRRDRWACRIAGPLCRGRATEVDHIHPGDNHSPENLRAVCTPCHARKSSREGALARARLRALRTRPLQRHPGMRQ